MADRPNEPVPVPAGFPTFVAPPPLGGAAPSGPSPVPPDPAPDPTPPPSKGMPWAVASLAFAGIALIAPVWGYLGLREDEPVLDRSDESEFLRFAAAFALGIWFVGAAATSLLFALVALGRSAEGTTAHRVANVGFVLAGVLLGAVALLLIVGIATT